MEMSKKIANNASDRLFSNNHKKFSFLYLLRLTAGLLLLSITLSTMGCVGLITRETQLGETYSEQKKNMTPPNYDKGRLFIYMVSGGPTPLNTSGIGAYCMVDNRVYRFLGASYFYVDLNAGSHKIVGDGRSAKKLLDGKKKYILEFDIMKNEIKYCRLEPSGYRDLKSAIVEPSVAELELTNLKVMINPNNL
jgi:hypothetical protein